MFSYSSVWSKISRELLWLWLLRHWDSGRTPCTMTDSVCRAIWVEMWREAIPLKSVRGGGKRRRRRGRIKLKPSFRRQSSHLSSGRCCSNAFKWVSPQTSASARWDVAQATLLLRHTTTGQLRGQRRGKATEDWSQVNAGHMSRTWVGEVQCLVELLDLQYCSTCNLMLN